MSAVWTDERVERLRVLAAAGRSASQIADDLGGGVSRNAVIGKALRSGIKIGADRKVVTVTKRKARAAAPKRAVQPPAPAKPVVVVKPVVPRAPVAVVKPPRPIEPKPEPIAAEILPEPDSASAVSILAARDGQCRFPLWGKVLPPVREAMVCGAPVKESKCAWCAHHFDRVTGKPGYGQSDKSIAQAAEIAA